MVLNILLKYFCFIIHTYCGYLLIAYIFKNVVDKSTYNFSYILKFKSYINIYLVMSVNFLLKYDIILAQKVMSMDGPGL